jgi:hypothetical protein
VERKALKWAKVRLDIKKGQLSSSALMLSKQSIAYFFFSKTDLHFCRFSMNHGSKRLSLSSALSKQYNEKWVFWSA